MGSCHVYSSDQTTIVSLTSHWSIGYRDQSEVSGAGEDDPNGRHIEVSVALLSYCSFIPWSTMVRDLYSLLYTSPCCFSRYDIVTESTIFHSTS